LRIPGVSSGVRGAIAGVRAGTRGSRVQARWRGACPRQLRACRRPADFPRGCVCRRPRNRARGACPQCFDLLADQQLRGGVCAPRGVSVLVTRKRAEANGSQVARCRSHRKLVAHYLAAALTISTAAPQALGQSTNARYGEGQVYIGRPRLYTARRWAAIQTLVAVASRQTARRTID